MTLWNKFKRLGKLNPSRFNPVGVIYYLIRLVGDAKLMRNLNVDLRVNTPSVKMRTFDSKLLMNTATLLE